MALWHFMPGERAGWQLRLVTCRPSGCEDVERAPVLLTDSGGAADLRATISVARPGGEVVVADVSGPPGVAPPLRLVFCADLRCAQPTVVTTEARTIPAAVTGFAPLAITVRPDGRPVVAYLDLPNGVVGVLSCDAVACLRPTMATPARVPAEGVPFSA